MEKSFLDTYPTFDNFFKTVKIVIIIECNKKNWLNIPLIDFSQTKNTIKAKNSVKSSMIKGKNKNTTCFRNVKQNQIN